ncbi:MAG: SLBB domain-containing protein [Planctomycetota bacterium]
MKNTIRRRSTTSLVLTTAAGATLAALAAGLSGCGVDSYLDPSKVGRWEKTPVEVPILRRIAAIEPDDRDGIEFTEPQPEDLRPEVTEYRASPGDVLVIIIFDYPAGGQQQPFEARVEDNGVIDLPGIGKFFILGLTADQIRNTVAEGLEAQDLIRNATVSSQFIQRRQNLFNIIGAVRAPGPYFIPEPGYRLLDAISAAGGLVDESTNEILVIRQIALDGEFGDPGRPGSSAPNNAAGVPQDIDDRPGRLLDLIEDINRENRDEANPSLIAGSELRLPSYAERTRPQISQPESAEPGDDGRAPAVDLIQPATDVGSNPSQWIFLDGKWVRIRDGGGVGVPGTGLPELADASEGAEQLVTQRIISVPAQDLLQGDASVNIVMRPGDVVRIPSPGAGTIYIGGEIARPGAYAFDPQLTLTRLITSAGGLGPIAIPERVDITRMVGTDRQATVGLDLRKIAEGTHPDIFLKPNDHINIGTNFWAFPLAVVRGGFRASYGFGFLLDRNFGNDVFGAPPTNRGF